MLKTILIHNVLNIGIGHCKPSVFSTAASTLLDGDFKEGTKIKEYSSTVSITVYPRAARTR